MACLANRTVTRYSGSLLRSDTQQGLHLALVQRTAADPRHRALLVAELLVWVGLVAQQHPVAGFDETDRAAGHQQLGLQCSVARQQAEQRLAGLHCLPGLDQLGGDHTRHRRADRQCAAGFGFHLLLLQCSQVTLEAGLVGEPLPRQLLLGLLQLGQTAAGGCGLALHGLHVACCLQQRRFLLFYLQRADVFVRLQLAQALQGFLGNPHLPLAGGDFLIQLDQLPARCSQLRGQTASLRGQQLALRTVRVLQTLLAARQALPHRGGR